MIVSAIAPSAPTASILKITSGPDRGLIQLASWPLRQAIGALSRDLDKPSVIAKASSLKTIEQAMQSFLPILATLEGLRRAGLEKLVPGSAARILGGAFDQAAVRASGLITSHVTALSAVNGMAVASKQGEPLTAVELLKLSSSLLERAVSTFTEKSPAALGRRNLAALTSIFEPSPNLQGDFCRVMHFIYDAGRTTFGREDLVCEQMIGGNRGVNTADIIVAALVDRGLVTESTKGIEVSEAACALWKLLQQEGDGAWYCAERATDPVAFAHGVIKDCSGLSNQLKKIIERFFASNPAAQFLRADAIAVCASCEGQMRFPTFVRLGIFAQEGDEKFALTKVGLQVVARLGMSTPAIAQSVDTIKVEPGERETPHPTEECAMSELRARFPDFDSRFAERIRRGLCKLLTHIPIGQRHVQAGEVKKILGENDGKYLLETLKAEQHRLLFPVAIGEYLLTFRVPVPVVVRQKAELIDVLPGVSTQTPPLATVSLPAAAVEAVGPKSKAVETRSPQEIAEGYRDRLMTAPRHRAVLIAVGPGGERLVKEVTAELAAQGIIYYESLAARQALEGMKLVELGTSTARVHEMLPSAEKAVLRLTAAGEIARRIALEIDQRLETAAIAGNSMSAEIRRRLMQR